MFFWWNLVKSHFMFFVIAEISLIQHVHVAQMIPEIRHDPPFLGPTVHPSDAMLRLTQLRTGRWWLSAIWRAPCNHRHMRMMICPCQAPYHRGYHDTQSCMGEESAKLPSILVLHVLIQRTFCLVASFFCFELWDGFLLNWLFQELWTGSISLGIDTWKRGLPMDLPAKADASAISDVSTCATNSRAMDGFNDASDDDLDASETSDTSAKCSWMNSLDGALQL